MGRKHRTLQTGLQITWMAALAIGLSVIGCDREEDSPTVTVAGAPTETAAETSTDEDPDAPGQPSATEDPSAQHSADLPEGTEEQDTRFMQARTAFLTDDYERAEALFEELAFDEPVTGQTVSAAIALGQIYVETDRQQEAAELFTDLQDHVADLPEVLLVLARTYAELDKPGLALQAYDRAYEQQADYIFILPEMAKILIQQDQQDRAADLLDRYEERLQRFVTKLEDPDNTPEEKRIYLVDIVGLLHDERAHQALQVALDDPSEPVRVEAATALGEMGVFEAESALRQTATDDESEAVRLAARQAIQSLRQLHEQFAQ